MKGMHGVYAGKYQTLPETEVNQKASSVRLDALPLLKRQRLPNLEIGLQIQHKVYENPSCLGCFVFVFCVFLQIFTS